MNKAFFYLSLLLIVCSVTFSQQLVGEWKSDQFNATLTFMSNGQYQLSHQGGIVNGLYRWQPPNLWFQDTQRRVSSYQVKTLTATQMSLMDAKGQTYTYTRRQNNTKPVDRTPGRVLARSGEYTLTTKHVQAGIDIIEFIVTQKIKSSEKDELTRASIYEFNKNPAPFLSEMAQLQQAVNTIHRATDSVKVGLARQQIFAEFYRATRNLPEESVPLLIRVIYRYVDVLAYDAKNHLALTDKDIDGFFSYLQFQYELADYKVDLTKEMRKEFTKTIVKNFNKLSQQQKTVLCCGNLLWTIIEKNWSNMTAQQRRQFVSSYRQKNQLQKKPEMQNWSNQAKEIKNKPKSLHEKQYDMYMKNQMFNMMNNMSLQNHATMMNVIENIGGTGNYWTVK